MPAPAEWDQPIPSTSGSRRPIVPRSVIPVSDDWEDDAEDWDEDEPQNTEGNQQIWENANSRAPMPSLIVSNSSHTSAAPPAAAFQPKMRILKRPTNPGPVAAPPSAPAGESLKEREARYQAARDRIFGTEGDRASSPGDKKGGGEASPAGVGVVRNPKGPASEAQDTPPKGFGARRSGNPPPSPNPLRDSEGVAAQQKPS
ncbi:hypothetical protein DFH06DRAFT_144627 [Mycena polygramma]|nr:hypothetical protein DFH06DRAFT_144627 [Mycena polygramma]